MAAAGTDEAVDGSSALKSQFQTSDEYNPAQAEPTLSAALSPNHAPASAVRNDLSVDGVYNNTKTSNAVPHRASHSQSATAPLGRSPEQHSQSRSMSRASSSSSSNNQVIITDQNPESMPQSSSGADGSVASVSIGASLQASTSPSTLPVDNHSSSDAPPDTDLQGGAFPNASVNVVPNPVLPETGVFLHSNSNTIPSETPQASSSADAVRPMQQQLNSTTSMTPKARLPHDKIGMLEDRIKDDPRGDVDAWLSLIDENRKRGKLEKARSVYERFFAVFPFAVRNAQMAALVLQYHANLFSG